jgi:hypothetical protein
MDWVKVGQGTVIALSCVGAAAGAIAASVPSLAVPGGATAAVCVAVVGVLGRYLPSAIQSVNEKAVALARAKAAPPPEGNP